MAKDENPDDLGGTSIPPSEFFKLSQESLPPKNPPSNRRERTDDDRNAADLACMQLRMIGDALASKYDLTKTTARLLSKSSKKFHAHIFTSRTGDPKVGGSQRAGQLLLDYYISYRVRDEIYALSIVTYMDDPHGYLRYQVLSPRKSSNKTWIPLDKLRPDIWGSILPSLDVGGCAHTDIFSAWEHLDELLSKVAVRRAPVNLLN